MDLEAKRLRERERENAQLKKMVGDHAPMAIRVTIRLLRE
jgi:hypothetical protein